MNSNNGKLEQWALLSLRLMVGFGIAAHGYAKLSRGPEHFATILTTLSVPAPLFTAWAVTLFEFLGGIAIMLGAAVTPLSIPLAIIMLVAMFTVHFPYGFSTIKLKAVSQVGAVFGPPGYEINLLYIASLLTLALASSSPLSIDGWLRRASIASISCRGATE